MSYLVLEPNQQGRRTGLARDGYNGPSLHERIQTTVGNGQDKMSSNGVTARNARRPIKEEDILRPPDGTTDEESSDEEDPRADIQHSAFKVASESIETTPEKKVPSSKFKSKESVSAAGSRITRKSTRKPTSTASIEASPGGQARMGTHKLGMGMADGFGMIQTSKRKSVYSSSSQGFGAQKSKRGISQEPPDKKPFKAPPKFDDPPESDDELTPAFKVAKLPNMDSPISSPGHFKMFRYPVLESPTSSPEKTLKFRAPNNSTNQGVEETEQSSQTTFKIFSDFLSDEDVPATEIPRLERTSLKCQKRIASVGPSATQIPTFQVFELVEELAENAGRVLQESQSASQNALDPILCPILEDEQFTPLSQRYCCPMCGAALDPNELSRYRKMTTRQQEKICRDHQSKSAMEEWSSKGYPEIDWVKLDFRISRHHAFIRELVNGGRSHYRDLLEETVNAGKDRSLMKMTTNLIPGYYGPRGLRIILENIMHRFTPVLKKRVVKDRLMAARGVTGFVQAVLVPEVAVLLICQDMDVDVEDAREILAESVGMGELVNEESADTVVRLVEDSENDDNDD